jgi:aryl-alcohol dehydrogenase-like predicted oxidoreductase
MNTVRQLGRLEVSVAGLGCNNFGRTLDQRATSSVVDAAIDAGVTVFDTADCYIDSLGASETLLGVALGGHREDVVISTKFGVVKPPEVSGGSPRWMARAVEASLNRLNTDRIDCYWLHKPDPTTPIGDTLEALGRMMDAGKVLEIGCSNFTLAQLEEAAAISAELGVPSFAAIQNEYSLIERGAEREVLPACPRLGMTFVPFFPLAAGLLTGKYRRGEEPPAGSRFQLLKDAPIGYGQRFLTSERITMVERLERYAADHGRSLPELALSWLASHRSVSTVITGATTAAQVRANTAAVTAWPMTEEQRAEISALLDDLSSIPAAET